jgi:polar amino acid transport system substrate-binding protein
MRKLLIAGVSLALTMHITSAWSQEFCGRSHVVVSGDTLSGLAERAFGRADRFMSFYNDPRNAEILGNNPDLLFVGSEIHLPPCAGDQIQAFVGSIERQRPKTSGDDFYRPIEIVTATAYPPFTDQDAPGRGMLTQVVTEALKASELPNDFRIDFINDWESHLKTLIPRGKYTMGFPWFQPDCSDPAALPEADRIRCDYFWSAPLYPVPVGFYAVDDASADIKDFADLHGKVLCRPAGYFIFDLYVVGLNEDSVRLERPDTPNECFAELERGNVDYVTINRFTAEKAIASAGLTGIVTPLESIVTVQPLHLVAHKNDVDAAYEWLKAFDLGLRRIKENGIYGQITTTHLNRHEKEVRDLEAAAN